MIQFQVLKENFTKGQLVDVSAFAQEKIGEGEILVKMDRFAFTANNITYAVVGDRMGYWRFFPAIGTDPKTWGVLPVWGFAEVMVSNVADIPVGDRLFGYFPPATSLKMSPVSISEQRFIDGAAHRSALPPGYNIYQRVNADPSYDPTTDNERMLLTPLLLTAYFIWDQLQEQSWYGAAQIVILSASSKTSIGLAYALRADQTAPTVIGLTSKRNIDLVSQLDLYDQSLTYEDLADIDPNIPTVIVDMSGNIATLTALYNHLGEQRKYCINVGLTHWGAAGEKGELLTERSEFFFAPSQIKKRLNEWGPALFHQKTATFMKETAEKTRDWLTFQELDGLNGLTEIYPEVCAGHIPPQQGLIVVL